MLLLALAVLAFVYWAAPTSEQEYRLDDVAFYARQLTDRTNYSTFPGFYYFTAFVQRLSNLSSLDTIRVSRLVFLVGILLVFVLAKLIFRDTSFALLAAFMYVFNAYNFNLFTVALRQMFAQLFFLGLAYASAKLLIRLQAQRPLSTHEWRIRAGSCLLFFLAIAFTHEITLLTVISAVVLYVFFLFAGERRVQERPFQYLACSLLLATLGLLSLRYGIVKMLPNYLSYSRVVYGLDMFVSTMTPVKLFLIVFFGMVIFSYASYAFIRQGKGTAFQQKLLFWAGNLSLVLLAIPVGWTFPGAVFLFGFYFVFYYFYSLLSRKPSLVDLLLSAWFVAAALLSRNAVFGLDFFMSRFEAELSIPFLLLSIRGVQEVLADYSRGWLSLPFIDALRGVDFTRGRQLLVMGFCLSAFLSNLWVTQFAMTPGGDVTIRGTDKEILAGTYLRSLDGSNLIATNDIIGLHQPLGKSIHYLASFWAGNLDEAVKDLRNNDIGFVVVAGTESVPIVNFGETTEWMYQTYFNLRTANFDKTFDAGPLSVYRFNFNGQYYYTADGYQAPFRGT